MNLNNIEHKEENGNYLINEDCFNIFPLVKDKSIDLILVDPPYGTTAISWDSPLDLPKLWEQYKRILKDNGTVIFFSSQPFTTDLINSNREWFKYEIIWNKLHGTDFQLSNHKPMKSHENILIFSKNKTTFNKQTTPRKKPLDTTNWKQDRKNNKHNNFSSTEPIKKVYNDKNPTTVFTYASQNAECQNVKRLHPTQKPLELISYLIKTYSNENELIMDNTMGSGTTCLSAKLNNRKYIGIEKETDIYNLAVTRLNKNLLF